MHIHILGICGTFMGGLALIARQAGHRVSGADAGVYPPMSEMLAREHIDLTEGYDPAQLDPAPDCVVIGNALSRGNPVVEAVLNRSLDYRSAPQWLAEEVLKNKWVLGVSGTHGKTTTSSILAWILEHAGLKPGFLIGGVPNNFGISARLGESDFFVIEADEYDSAFFDKRSKFVHFRPRTLIINNIEYDHADIFPDLATIERQFHHQVRTVPGEGLIVANGDDANVADTLALGCWTPVSRFGSGCEWRVEDLSADGRAFTLVHGDSRWPVRWSQAGLHNAHNALAAVIAARHVGVAVEHAVEALARFGGVKRRLELRGEAGGVLVYDDFAHHPTAIVATIKALSGESSGQRVLAVVEPRSNTMRLGVHKDSLGQALAGADLAFLLQPAGADWDVRASVAALGERAFVGDDVDALVVAVTAAARAGDRILVMSNGAFGGIHGKLLDALGAQCD